MLQQANKWFPNQGEQREFQIFYNNTKREDNWGREEGAMAKKGGTPTSLQTWQVLFFSLLKESHPRKFNRRVPDWNSWLWELCQQRENVTDTVILTSQEKSPIIEDSLYRTEAHAVIPLNGKRFFCYSPLMLLVCRDLWLLSLYTLIFLCLFFFKKKLLLLFIRRIQHFWSHNHHNCRWYCCFCSLQRCERLHKM